MFRRLVVALVWVALFLPAAGMAEEIAFFGGQSQNTFVLTDTSTTETFTVTGAPVYFYYLVSVPQVPFGENGILNMSATTSTTATGSGNNLSETGFSGWFTISNLAQDTVLLEGTFDPSGTLTGGGNGLTFTESTTTNPFSEVLFESSYLGFSNSTSMTVSFSMSNINPSVTVDGNDFLSPGTGGIGGQFSADPPPFIAPEPTTWLLGGGALLGIGLLLWKRKHRPVL